MAARPHKLYAARVTPETVRKAEKERFARITSAYMLLYRRTKPRDIPTVEIKGQDLHRLTQEDRLWLADCLAVQMAEQVRKHTEDTRKRLNGLLDAWERELAKEQARIDGEADDGTAEEPDN